MAQLSYLSKSMGTSQIRRQDLLVSAPDLALIQTSALSCRDRGRAAHMPVCDGALAYLAADDRKMGDCHGKRRDVDLLITSYGASPAAVAHAVPCGGRHVHGVRDTGLRRLGGELRWHRRWCPGTFARSVVPARGRRGTVPAASRFPGAAPGSSRIHRAARCAARALNQPWRAQRTAQSWAGHVSSRPHEGEVARSGGLPGAW